MSNTKCFALGFVLGWFIGCAYFIFKTSFLGQLSAHQRDMPRDCTYIHLESGNTDEPHLLYVLTEERSTMQWSNSTFSQRLSLAVPFVTSSRDTPVVREITLRKKLDAIKYALMEPDRIQWFVLSHSIDRDFIGIIDPFLIEYTVRTATLFTVNELNGATVSSAMKRIGKHWAMDLENAIQSNYSYVKIYSF